MNLTDEKIDALLKTLDQYCRTKDIHCSLPLGWSVEIDEWLRKIVREALA